MTTPTPPPPAPKTPAVAPTATPVVPHKDSFVPVTKETYDDTDLVYVDVEGKKVVGLVEWLPNDKPKKLAMPERVEKEGDRPRRGPRDTRYYPWGTYRSMKRVYQLEGKIRKTDNSATLDDVLPKALEQAFWE